MALSIMIENSYYVSVNDNYYQMRVSKNAPSTGSGNIFALVNP